MKKATRMRGIEVNGCLYSSCYHVGLFAPGPLRRGWQKASTVSRTERRDGIKPALSSLPPEIAVRQSPNISVRLSGQTSRSDLLGLFGLYLYALAALFSSAAMNVAIACMAVAALIQWPAVQQWARRQCVLLPVVGLMIFLVVRGYFAAVEFPGTAGAQRESTIDLLAATGPSLLLGAYWLGRNGHPGERAQRVLLLATAGVLAYLTHAGAWGALLHSPNERLAMGMSPNAVGLIASVLLWGATLRLLAGTVRMPRSAGAWCAILGLFALFLFAAVMLVLSGSKSAWVATLVVLPLATAYYVFRVLAPRQRRNSLIVLASLLTMAIGYATIHGDEVIKRRLTSAWDASERIVADRGTSVNDGSIGPRLQMWQDALPNIAQRPLAGWGPGSARVVLQKSPTPEIQMFPHFHNLPLNLLVTLGIVGTLLFYATQVGVVVTAWRSFRKKALTAELAFFALGGLGLFHVAHMFQYRLNNTPGQFILALMGMIALSASASPPGNGDPAGRPAHRT